MDKEFKNKLSQNLHLHFGYFYDQNGKKIKPDEIITWFEKQEQPIKSDAVGDVEKANKALQNILEICDNANLSSFSQMRDAIIESVEISDNYLQSLKQQPINNKL